MTDKERTEAIKMMALAAIVYLKLFKALAKKL